MSTPRVSVLTATYNSAGFLAETIRSILNQSFGDFEYLIVDDASQDESLAIIAEHARQDDRIRPIANPVRAGPGGALNIALHQARGDYIAILDHDDLALPERLARQVDYMDAHADHGAIGSAVRSIDTLGNTLYQQTYPLHSAVARWGLLFGASLLHSASLYRRSLIQRLGGYSTHHNYLCDYELLIRVAQETFIGNLHEVLVCYRRHPHQTSALHFQRQTGQMLLLQFALQTRWLGYRPNLESFRALRQWLHGTPPTDANLAHAAVDSLQRLYETYVAGADLDRTGREQVARDCALRWARIAHHGYRTHAELSRACWHAGHRLAPDLKGNLDTRRSLRRGSPQWTNDTRLTSDQGNNDTFPQ